LATTSSDGVTRAATRMGAATLVSRSIGFVRVWMIATVLGTTYLGNTYQGSSSVSNVLFELLAAGALSAVLVPTFVEHLDLGDQAEAERLASGILGLALVVLGVVTVIGLIAAPEIAKLLTTRAPDPEIAEQQQALSTFFLYFFIPQILLYSWGTVSTAVLYAKRRFAIAAMAPIANTVAVVIALTIFWLMHGTNGDLDLTLAEKLVLALGATFGVLGFVGLPAVALHRTGFRLRPRLHARDDRLRHLIRLSGWAVLQHAGIGILLGAAIVMGNGVAGGVVAYQFAFVLFLAPYAILAHPVQTTILPELTLDAKRGDTAAFARGVRSSLDRLSILVVPVSAAFVALSVPAMRAITVHDDASVELLAAALASLGVGLFFYSVFLLLARALYALGDSRTPAITALITACVGAAFMVVGVNQTSGSDRVLMLGLGHSLAYLLGALALGLVLRRRLREPLFPRALPITAAASAVLGVAAWGLFRLVGPTGRVVTIAMLVGVGVVGAGLYFGVVRLTRLQGVPTGRDAESQGGTESPADRSSS
jgi:putative peptidoglycan lipid II flippase